MPPPYFEGPKSSKGELLMIAAAENGGNGGSKGDIFGSKDLGPPYDRGPLSSDHRYASGLAVTN